MVVGLVETAVPTAKSTISSVVKKPTFLSSDPIINVARGDPTIYEPYWKKMGDRCKVVIAGDEFMSYFCNTMNLCWFLLPELDNAIRTLHRVVGNAMVDDDRFIIVGNGSTQLFHALLYALSSPDLPEPINVVAAAPFYSSYPEETKFLQSKLYKWAGDANCYDKDEPYIEVVTSPNNPDGSIRGTVVNREGSKAIHDLAYYWPQYAPITSKADHDAMLFTFSKATGHAGTRIGWAIVKDKVIAAKMVKFIEVSSIGVSREAQLRAAKILGVIADDCRNPDHKGENLFQYGRHLMSERWGKLREVGMKSNAFAWLKSKEGLNCENLLRDKSKIITRGGPSFGVDSTYTRVSMLSRDVEFELLLERLAAIKGTVNGN
ncbi:hypothetical protein ERO13_A04G136350v2 [Gossypium hirsutum]|nr:hypothetical protein ERO13_A04G136350v2 [Gossypium hirsutum]